MNKVTKKRFYLLESAVNYEIKLLSKLGEQNFIKFYWCVKPLIKFFLIDLIQSHANENYEI